MNFHFNLGFIGEQSFHQFDFEITSKMSSQRNSNLTFSRPTSISEQMIHDLVKSGWLTTNHLIEWKKSTESFKRAKADFAGNFSQKLHEKKFIIYDGHSAACRALAIGLRRMSSESIHESLRMYDVLMENGFDLSSSESLKEIAQVLRVEEHQNYVKFAEAYKSIQIKYEKKLSIDHIELLIGRCYGPSQLDESIQFYNQKVREAFMQLNDNRKLSPLLQLLAVDGRTKFTFDFSRKSVDRLSPAKHSAVYGVSYPEYAEIEVGAVGLVEDSFRDFEGTLIHEICHIAMEILYNNEANPFHKDDSSRHNEYHSIVKECENIVARNDEETNKRWSAIKRVFSSEFELDWKLKELIVRVPQIYAENRNNLQNLQYCYDTFRLLFEFYEDYVLADIKDKITKIECSKIVAVINDSCGVKRMIENRGEKFSEKYVKNNSNILKEPLSAIFTNCIKLTLKLIVQLIEISSCDGDFIFMSCKDLDDGKVMEIIKKASEFTKPRIIVDCENYTEDIQALSLRVDKVLLNPITYVRNDHTGSHCINVEKNQFQMFHSWSDLDESSQFLLRNTNILFQGISMELGSVVISKESQCLDFIDLDALINNKLKIGDDVKFRETNSYIERALFRSSCDNDEKKLFDVIEKDMTVLISDEPGVGKTTEMKVTAEKMKKEKLDHFVFFWDLKKYHEVYEKNGRSKKSKIQSKKDLFEFLCEKVLKFDAFQAKLFCSLYNASKVVFFIDGYDEICPSYNILIENVIVLISKTGFNRMCIASRPHHGGVLEKSLNVQALKIREFSASTSNIYLMRVFHEKTIEHFSDDWRKFYPREEFIAPENSVTNNFDSITKTFFEEIIDYTQIARTEPSFEQTWEKVQCMYQQFFEKERLSSFLEIQLTAILSMICKDVKETLDRLHGLLSLLNRIKVTRNPLVMNMIGEIFSDPEEKHDYTWTTFNFYHVYDLFIEKLLRRFTQKGPEATVDVVKMLNTGFDTVGPLGFFQKKAFEVMFNEGDAILEIFKNIEFQMTFEQVARVGIMTAESQERLFFVHNTIAEYLVARFFREKLLLDKHVNLDKLPLFLDTFKGICKNYNNFPFVFKLLEDSLELQPATFVQNPSKLIEIQKAFKPISFQELDPQLIKQNCFQLFKVVSITFTAKRAQSIAIWLGNNVNEKASKHKRKNVYLFTLQNLSLAENLRFFELGFEVFDHSDIRTLLFDKNNIGDGVLHYIVRKKEENFITESFQYLKGKLGNDFVNLLLQQNNKKQNFLFAVLSLQSLEMCKNALHEVEVFFHDYDKDLFKSLLTTTDDEGKNLLHVACDECSTPNVLEVLFDLFKRNFNSEEIQGILLQKTKKERRTLLMLVASKGNLKSVRSLKKFVQTMAIFETDSSDKSAIHHAAMNTHDDVFVSISDLYIDVESSQRVERDKILMKTNSNLENILVKCMHPMVASVVWTFLIEIFCGKKREAQLKEMLTKNIQGRYVNTRFIFFECFHKYFSSFSLSEQSSYISSTDLVCASSSKDPFIKTCSFEYIESLFNSFKDPKISREFFAQRTKFNESVLHFAILNHRSRMKENRSIQQESREKSSLFVDVYEFLLTKAKEALDESEFKELLLLEDNTNRTCAFDKHGGLRDRNTIEKYIDDEAFIEKFRTKKNLTPLEMMEELGLC